MKNFKYSILKDFILVFRQSDGPAIKGGCVTRRKHRAGNRDTLARNLPRCKEGMAHFLQPPFCKKCDKQLTFIVRVIVRNYYCH